MDTKVRVRIVRSGLIILAILGIAGTYLVGHFMGRVYQTNERCEGDLMHYLALLRDMDGGDVKVARGSLNEDAMVLLVNVLANCKFTTNKDVLVKRPGIRAAARCWAENVPEVPEIDSDMHALIQKRLAIVKDEMERQRVEKTAK